MRPNKQHHQWSTVFKLALISTDGPAYFRISCTNSNIGIVFYSIIHSTTKSYSLRVFFSIIIILLNGPRTLWFNPQSMKVKPHNTNWGLPLGMKRLTFLFFSTANARVAVAPLISRSGGKPQRCWRRCGCRLEPRPHRCVLKNTRFNLPENDCRVHKRFRIVLTCTR